MNKLAGLDVLIRKIASGNQQAQAELYELMYRPLFKYLLNHFTPTLAEEDIEEITQQSIIQIYRYAGQFEGIHNEQSALRWVHKIARHQALKWVRTLKKTISVWEVTQQDLKTDEYTLFDDLLLAYSPISPEDGLEEQVVNKLIWEVIRECIAKLDEREREIINMRYIKDLTLEEIAQRYQIKRPRVHQVLGAIHHKLRRAAKLDEL